MSDFTSREEQNTKINKLLLQSGMRCIHPATSRVQCAEIHIICLCKRLIVIIIIITFYLFRSVACLTGSSTTRAARTEQLANDNFLLV